MAATAITHQINANLLRRWVVLQSVRSACSQSPAALLPVTVRPQFTASPSARASSDAATASELIEIDFHGARVRLHGPTDAQRLGVVLDALAQRR